jgi:predicted nucleic acid-binding protein
VSYLLDSNIVIALLANDHATLQLLDRIAETGVSISAISYMEVSQGFHQIPGTDRRIFDELIASLAVIPIDIAIAERCARIRADLHFQRRRVRPRSLDLLIAATAIEHEMILVTRNVGDFEDLPDLLLHR